MIKVLYIEDDAVLRENTAELLELSGFNVITAPNGKIGIEKAKSELPDIILCDIMMLGIDGYGVLEALSKDKQTQLIPFIFLSAKTERQDIRKGMNLGADDYITKPFTEEELVSAINSRIAKIKILKEEQDKTFSSDETKEVDEIKNLNELKEYINENGEEFNYNLGEYIYREGKNSNLIYLIRKGIVKCYKHDELGKELTTALFKEDDIFGYTSFTENLPYQETAMAINEVKVVGLSKAEFNTILATNHNLAFELIQQLSNDLFDAKEQLLQLAYSTVNKKTAATILKFAKKLNKNPEDPIRISRTDLASVAGIATETFIRTMSDFKREGLIEIEGRNIKVLNINKLELIK
jgi:CRP-like cAMP-binding protein/CheY-like chemotaxis protein